MVDVVQILEGAVSSKKKWEEYQNDGSPNFNMDMADSASSLCKKNYQYHIPENSSVELLLS